MQKKPFTFFVLLLVLGQIPFGLNLSAPPSSSGQVSEQLPHPSAVDIPGIFDASFIENQGQFADTEVLFYWQSETCGIGLKSDGFLYWTIQSLSLNTPTKQVLNITFTKCNGILPYGEHRLESPRHYFLASPSALSVNSYQEIWYSDLYEGIDLRFFFEASHLKYEYHIHPFADPSLIHMDLVSALPFLLFQEDDSVVAMMDDPTHPIELYRDSNLVAYQSGSAVEASFQIYDNHAYGFCLGEFDRTRELVIDPIIFEWDQFVDYYESADIYVDSDKNVYSIIDEDCFNGNRITLTKFDSGGHNVLFSTTLGSSGCDIRPKIYVNNDFEIFIVFQTSSEDLPLVNGSYNDTIEKPNIYITRLNQTGNGIIYGTYVGGGVIYPGIIDLEVDDNNDLYLLGTTQSNDFPLVNPLQTTRTGHYGDNFLFKLNSSGNGLIFSTYLGGYESSLTGLCVDSNHNIIVSGHSLYEDYPIVNALQPMKNGLRDLVITKLNQSGNGIIFSTYLGGNEEDYSLDMVLDSQDNIILGCETTSSDFPTLNGYQMSSGFGGTDVAVLKLSSTGDTILSGTYLAGNSWDDLYNIGIDSNDNIYIAGSTCSANFPYLLQILTDECALFFAKFSGNLTNLVYCAKTAEESSRFYRRFEGYSCDDDGYVYYLYKKVLHKISNVTSNENLIPINEDINDSDTNNNDNEPTDSDTNNNDNEPTNPNGSDQNNNDPNNFSFNSIHLLILGLVFAGILIVYITQNKNKEMVLGSKRDVKKELSPIRFCPNCGAHFDRNSRMLLYSKKQAYCTQCDHLIFE